MARGYVAPTCEDLKSMASTLSSTSAGLRDAQRILAQERILRAARSAFVESGIAAASMDEIALLAGVSRATLYRHFAGKEALLEGLIVEDWERQVKLFRELASAPNPDLDMVRTWLKRLVRATQARKESLRLYVAASAPSVLSPNRLAQQRRRLADALGAGFFAFVDPHPRKVVEARLIIVEIEQFCGYAASRAATEEVEIAVDLIAARFAAFAF
jgi:AcrR family transcriptional regulator